MHRAALLACLCLLLPPVSGRAVPVDAGASTPAAVTADTPRTSAAGTRFVVPAGWTIRTRGHATVLTTPEGGSRIALVDVGPARDADAALAAGWAAYDAKARWPLKLASDRVARDGWDQIRGYAYQLPNGAARAVSAQARRHGDRWTVAIHDMADDVGDKRESQVDLVYGRLWPNGYAPETFAGRTAHALDAARIAVLTRFIDDARRQFDVPGVAIGVVQHGKVVFAGGFGVRELGRPEPVDAATLFMIASNNKALTTLMLAKEVDAGRFAWDTPVTQVMPTFRLGDADTTARVRMRHLVCACTGMPRQDMEIVFQGEVATPSSVLDTLATMQPTSGFGELYQYSNPMAAAAGYVGGHALFPRLEPGAAYDRAMQSLVFAPLGMASTTFDFDRALRGNHAMPHARSVAGVTSVVDLDFNRNVIASRPDGGAWSTVDDMLRYVRMELANGLLPDGSRYIAAAPLLERRVQQVATGSDTGYGMGLKIDRSWGTPVIHHGGSESGYRSDMVWLPEHDVGAVILINSDDGVALRYPFRRRLVELLFDGTPEAEQNVTVQARRMRDAIPVERQRLTVPAAASVVGALAARYRSAELGDLAVSTRGDATWFDFGGWKSEMATVRGDDGATRLVTVSPGKAGFEFAVTDGDGRRRLTLRDAQRAYVFEESE